MSNHEQSFCIKRRTAAEPSLALFFKQMCNRLHKLASYR